jgi:LVIVD repeat
MKSPAKHPTLFNLTALTIALLTACGTVPNTGPTTMVITSQTNVPTVPDNATANSGTANSGTANSGTAIQTPQETVQTKTVTVINDPATLEQGITRATQSLQVQALNVQSVGKLEAKAFIANPWSFKLIAKIDPPTTPKGVQVRATHISFNGNYAIVSYNREGATFAGALEVYDISDTSHPLRISQALFDDMDANVISSPDEDLTGLSKGRLYVGGARNIAGTGRVRPAVLEEFSISNGQLGTTVKSIELDGYSTNSIARFGPLVMTSSGNADCDDPSDPLRGGVSVTRTNIFETGSPLETIKLKTFCNAQAVAVHHARGNETSYLAALEAGINGKLHVYNMSVPFKSNPSLLLNTSQRTINIGSVTPVDNKNGLEIHRGLAWVAAGDAGVKAFNLGTFSSTPAYTLMADDVPGQTANSISIDGDTAYVAFGNGGVYVAQIPQCNDPTKLGAKHANCNQDVLPLENKVLDWYGKFADVGGSANFAAAKNCLIFIASGEGGLRIVRKFP